MAVRVLTAGRGRAAVHVAARVGELLGVATRKRGRGLSIRPHCRSPPSVAAAVVFGHLSTTNIGADGGQGRVAIGIVAVVLDFLSPLFLRFLL